MEYGLFQHELLRFTACAPTQHTTPHTQRPILLALAKTHVSCIEFLQSRFISNNMHIRSWQVLSFTMIFCCTIWFPSIFLAFTPQLIHLLNRIPFCSIHISSCLQQAIFQTMLDEYCKFTVFLCEYPVLTCNVNFNAECMK